MISESATGMSNGGRVSSASDATRKITNPTGWVSANQYRSWASTIPIIDRVPACITIEAAASTSGSSYAMSCAAARSAPINENLFAEDQPAMSTPITVTEVIDITKKIPTSRLRMKIWFEKGITTNSAMYGTSATAGASENTHRSAAAGMMSSFWMNFTPSAISCAQPWNRPAYIGPSRDCMCASTLCSAYPTPSGAVRKKINTTAVLTARINQ
jgi:hypothetical protein